MNPGDTHQEVDCFQFLYEDSDKCEFWSQKGYLSPPVWIIRYTSHYGDDVSTAILYLWDGGRELAAKFTRKGAILTEVTRELLRTQALQAAYCLQEGKPFEGKTAEKAV